MGFLRRLLRREPSVGVHKLGGNVLVIGDDLFEGMTTPHPPPTQAALDTIIAQATRVEVREVMGKSLLATEDDEDLRALRRALRVDDGGIGHCMCLGSLEFRFRQQRKELGAVTLHHGVSLRWQPFFDNAALADPEPLLDWLSARGITSEREEYEEARREDAEFEAAKARWRAAIPEALEPHWDTMRELRLEWPDLNDVLTAAHPEPVGRARVLFRWLGHGRGPWSGFPTYETVPEWCLLQVPLDALLEAAQVAPEDELLREGAARLFAGWSFATERRDDVEMIPADVRRMLLAHALASSDEDKRDRARAAFE